MIAPKNNSKQILRCVREELRHSLEKELDEWHAPSNEQYEIVQNLVSLGKYMEAVEVVRAVSQLAEDIVEPYLIDLLLASDWIHRIPCTG
jgi:hypothetical protein